MRLECRDYGTLESGFIMRVLTSRIRTLQRALKCITRRQAGSKSHKVCARTNFGSVRAITYNRCPPHSFRSVSSINKSWYIREYSLWRNRVLKCGIGETEGAGQGVLLESSLKHWQATGSC